MSRMRLATDGLNPSPCPIRTVTHHRLSAILNFVDLTAEAIPVLPSLTRLDPAQRYMHLFQIALCYRRPGRSDEAIAKHRECVAANPEFFGAHMQLASIHAEIGDMNHARAALAEVLRLRPDFSIARNLRTVGLREE